MKVNRPRNINDGDLMSKPADFSRPLSEITSMSYYMRRIRMAEVYREAADISWELLTASDAAFTSYDRVIALDRRLDDLSHEYEDFYCLDEAEFRIRDYSQPQIQKQKLFSYLMYMGRRCKLHLPFLLRLKQDTRFRFSQRISLRSAREMLKLSHVMSSSPTKCSIKLPGVLYHFFVAILVLVIDFCVSQDAGDLTSRKTEIQEACKILTSAKNRSAAASTLLDSLERILQKHNIRLMDEAPPSGGFPEPAATIQTDHISKVSTTGTASVMTSNGRSQLAGTEIDSTDQINNMDFDEIWQGYVEFGTYADPQDWDALFNDLDMNLD